MTSETVRIHFLSNVLTGCHLEILLPRQRDAATSSLSESLEFGLSFDLMIQSQ